MSHSWIIDTGASCHVSSNLDLFCHVSSITDTSVTLPDATRIPVTISGSVELSSDLLLTDVLYIPHFKFNLLRVSALTRNSEISVLFSSHSCFIFPHNPFLL